MLNAERWRCDICEDTWTMVRGADDGDGACPDCGRPMLRVDDDDNNPTPASAPGAGDAGG